MNQLPISRRRVLYGAAGTIAAMLGAAACGGERGDAGSGPYRGGRLSIATGNTTGVYYQLGGGYADLISKHLKGYKATAEATGASVENLQRVARGDSDIAFTLADAAADAALGSGAFDSEQPIRALARIYTNYTQVVSLRKSKITKLEDMRGKRISTGSPNSGTENIAHRLLAAAGLDPEKDIRKQALSLPETVQGMKDGNLDALFWSGGLPTPGITDLVTSLEDDVVFLPLEDYLTTLQEKYGEIYLAEALPKATYSTPDDVPTIAVPNLLVVSEKMPDKLAHDLTKLLFDHTDDLSKVHPEGKNITRDVASKTEPVQLHPGVKKYLG
ncbi:MAG: TAXI family TRAP transporter solute-binding subunit [Micromonosporaceae bacterium]